MQFSSHTLVSTSRRFEAALMEEGLSLSFSAANNVWAQIVLGRDFSAAKSYVDDRGYVNAVAITADTISAKLKEKSRTIAPESAYKLFAEVIRDDLPALSYCMTELVWFLTGREQTCLISVVGDRSGLGIMDATNAGYLPVSKMKFANGRDQEIAWLRSSSDLVVSIVNTLAGVSKDQRFDIFAANHRAGDEKKDEAFARYFSQRVIPCGQLLAEGVLASFDPSQKKVRGDIDYDSVRDIVYDVIERETREGNDSWLKPDCELGEAMIDHLAARIREALRWLSDEVADGRDHDSPMEAVAHTAQLSMQKFLKIREIS